MATRDDVPIRVFGSRPDTATYDTQDEPRIAEIIREQVLDRTDAEYLRADVEVRRRSDRTPDHLVAYLLRKDIYRAEVVRVDVDADYEVGAVTFDYSGDEDDEDDEQRPDALTDEDVGVDDVAAEGVEVSDVDESDDAVDFVAATPVPEITTARKAVEELHQMATAAGLRSVELFGPQASVSRYRELLGAGVKGFVNIGHGNPSGIVLDDGVLRARWFANQPDDALRPAVVYLNSCQVFNDPLQPAVMDAGARTFVGGIVNLLIGPSEQVCTCFWKRALTSDQRMGASLTQCETEHYPDQGAHGLSGDGGPFGLVRFERAHAMRTHGNGLQIQHPARLSSERRYGALTRLRGKPFTGNWIHFQIPTPVIVDKERLRVDSVMIRYRIGPGAYVDAVHVWDGDRRIAVHNGLKRSPGKMTWQRFGVPGHPPVKWGLGVSVGIKFGDGANLPGNGLTMDFASAGADFVRRC